MANRCGNATCDCYVVDPQLYSDLRVTKTTDTLVFGSGSEEDPFYFQNIHNVNFRVPAVRLRTTLPPITAGVASTISWDIEDFDTFNMHSTDDPTNIRVPTSGYYMYGLFVHWNAPAGGTFLQRTRVLINITDLGQFTFMEASSSLRDENPNAAAPRQTGNTFAKLSGPARPGQIHASTYLLLGSKISISVEATDNLGASDAVFYCVYV